MVVLNRYVGSLLGLAVGDCVGAPLEFKMPGSFALVQDMVGGGRHNLLPGQWTDDTSMALCLAESLVHRGFNPVDQLERYTRWHRQGYLSSTGKCFDIGKTTLKALLRFEVSRQPYCGRIGDRASNGSLMRLAPVPLFYAGNPQEAIKYSADSSRTTHGAPASVDACRYLSALIIGAVNGVGKDELLSDHFSPVPEYWHENPLMPTISEVASGSFKHKNPPEIEGSGNAANCLEAALWAFYTTNTFKTGCLRAVNLGDDADTTGAVYGQLAGAYYGQKGIPLAWRKKLYRRKFIESLAKQIFVLAWQQV
jgi:ADP-ribosyl-[dinitrogen reductase] hydrolase